jgi:hypothetical protein
MNITSNVLPALAAFAVGCFGYFLGTAGDRPVAQLSANRAVPLEYYAPAKTFSEIENTRALLDALAARYVEHARVLIVEEFVHQTAHRRTGGLNPDRPRLQAIRLLEEGLAQFEGTDQAVRLVPTLLYALKREALPDRWLDVYLAVLYRHPTHELLPAMAHDALQMARAAGREREVATAFDHWLRIPSEFRPDNRPVSDLVLLEPATKGLELSVDHVL